MDDFHNTTVAVNTPPSISHLDPDASRFPAEIYERIVDFLAYEALLDETSPEPSTLASCCLTSRWWFPRSRFHLYFQVMLDSRARFESLGRCLETCPTNSVFVRKLFIIPSEDQGWVSAVPLTLAPRLKNLSMLQLDDVKLPSLHPSFSQHLATFSTISELKLYGTSLRALSLMRMVFALPRLRKLRISANMESQSSRDEAATLAMARRKRSLPLRHLSLWEDSALVLLPALAASATPLTTLDFLLSFRVSARDIERALQSLDLFLSSCDTLRVLRLASYALPGHAVCSHISISSLSKLHHFRFSTDIKEAEDIAAVAGLVSTISAHPLQFLKLKLSVGQNPKILDTLTPWEVLNESLLRPSIRLTGEIAVSIRVEHKKYASEEEVFRLLPALKSMNTVHRRTHLRFTEFWDKL